MGKIDEVRLGLETAYIDGSVVSSNVYRPQFVSNNHKEGKIEAGETPQEALRREIMEELDTDISVGEFVDTIEYDYPQFHLSMDCFWCQIVSGNLVLKEHEAARWLTKGQLNEVEWLPADVTLISKVVEMI